MFVSSGDTHAPALAIIRLFRGRDEARRMGVAKRQWVRPVFSFEQMSMVSGTAVVMSDRSSLPEAVSAAEFSWVATEALRVSRQVAM